MTAAFFTIDGEWFRPTDYCRGPWDPNACHAGPPTGLLARASEQLVPDQQLVRLTVDLTRPIPHAGFRIDAAVDPQGPHGQHDRDDDRRRRRPAGGLGPRDARRRVPIPGELPTAPFSTPTSGGRRNPASSRSRPAVTGCRCSPSAVEMRYPPGDGPRPGADSGMDAHRPVAGRRGAVAVPADLPARRLRQRDLAQRQPAAADVSSTPTSRSCSIGHRSASGSAPTRSRGGSQPASA